MHTRLAGTLPVILDLYMVLISPILVKSQIGLNTIKSLVVKKKKKKANMSARAEDIYSITLMLPSTFCSHM